MTTTKINRRTALAGAAAGTLIPVAGLAQAAITPNATDAAWAEYQAARAAYEAHSEAHDAWEAANVPERLHWGHGPKWADYDDEGEHEAAEREWRRERDAYHNPHDLDDDQLDAFCQPINDAEAALLETPPATMTDLERKISAILESDRGDDFAREDIERLLADVRALDGRAV